MKDITDNFHLDKYVKRMNNFTKKQSALMFLLFRISYRSNKEFKPADINKEMLNKVTGTVVSDDFLLNSTGIQSKQFISEKRLSEILASLEKAGLFQHLGSKKDIRRVIGIRRGKLNGRPSLYLVSQKFITIKKILSNPEAVNMIVTSLIDSDLLVKFISCILHGFLEFVKITNEEQLSKAFRSVINERSDDISENAKSYMKIKLSLSSLNKTQMDELIKESTKDSIKSLLNDKREFLTHVLVLLGEIENLRN
jgi:hypothetical protein